MVFRAKIFAIQAVRFFIFPFYNILTMKSNKSFFCFPLLFSLVFLNIGVAYSADVTISKDSFGKPILDITNKVRLCEQSEPQSEPFVGQARCRRADGVLYY